MLASKLLSASGGEDKLFVDDCFAVALYTGNGSTQTITNGIDLAGKGGLIWCKSRGNEGGAWGHALVDTTRGKNAFLSTNTNDGNQVCTGDIAAFNANGVTYNAPTNTSNFNRSGTTYVNWVFRNADKFYGHAVVTKSSGSNATVSFANLGTLGMVRVKRTNSPGSWYIWHRSLSAGQLLIGETTAAAATLGHVTVSGTTVTLVNGVIADGTYLVEAFAHDDSADGIIQCGSFTADGGGNATVTLGWEPQYLIAKRSDSVTSGAWQMYDTMRGMALSGASQLQAQSSGAEAALGGSAVWPTTTGFAGDATVLAASATYIYLAIRRPNKPPTTGTQVYNAIARTGTGAAATVTGVGFAPDLVVGHDRGGFGFGTVADRLRGVARQMDTTVTAAETSASNVVLSFNMNGVTFGDGGGYNQSGFAYANWFFRRAPGVFDIVCYTGTGVARTVSHSLGVAPELMIVKGRNVATGWTTYCSYLTDPANSLLPGLTTSSAAAIGGYGSYWDYKNPSATELYFGAGTAYTNSGNTVVAYLFATKAGISKVGSYTGNGSNQTINCGFSTGARFFLVKATSTTGSWWVFDSARGVISAADPALQLNSTAAEVTSADAVDPASVGIVVNQEATCSINANGVSYIYLAIT